MSIRIRENHSLNCSMDSKTKIRNLLFLMLSKLKFQIDFETSVCEKYWLSWNYLASLPFHTPFKKAYCCDVFDKMWLMFEKLKIMFSWASLEQYRIKISNIYWCFFDLRSVDQVWLLESVIFMKSKIYDNEKYSQKC